MRTVAVLEVDPGLGARLSPEDFALARQHVHANVVTLMRGAHSPDVIGGPDLLALLVVEGWLIRSVSLGGRVSGMLIGPGALLRPWDDHVRYGTLPFQVDWRAVQPTHLAMLDHRTMAAAARWPGLMHSLFRRSSERSHIQSLLAAVRALQHVELRLRALLWLYAGRYGQRGSDGVVLPIRLGHQDLADLTGSQRPSVSAHLAALSASGDIVRRPDRTWLLRGGPPDDLHDLRVRAGSQADAEVC
jgi:CRP/FNR family transcriptional regulator, cyclic AMP receptor protein